MVETERRDGRRIAELLASEIDGRSSGPLGRLTVSNPDRSVEGNPGGERAYDVRVLRADRDPRRVPEPDEAGELFARVFVHPERAHVEFHRGVDASGQHAAEVGLRVRPKATRPPKTLVFVERAADVKRMSDVFEAAVDAAAADAAADDGEAGDGDGEASDGGRDGASTNQENEGSNPVGR